MGGHAAWKKRVANGELAKGAGGAIMRHRPRWGRKGKDLIKNRKGHIGGGNPKKQKSDKGSRDIVVESPGEKPRRFFVSANMAAMLGVAIVSFLLIASFYYATTLGYR